MVWVTLTSQKGTVIMTAINLTPLAFVVGIAQKMLTTTTFAIQMNRVVQFNQPQLRSKRSV